MRARSVPILIVTLLAATLYVWIGRAVGYPAGAIAALGPMWLWNAKFFSRAMTDPMYLFFVVLMSIAAVNLCRTTVRKNMTAWAVLFGISVGLAYNIKIGGFPLGAMIFVGVVACRTWCVGLEPRQVLRMGLAAWLPALVLVFILNPVLWPSGGAARMLYFFQMFFEWRDLYTVISVEQLETPLARLRVILKQPLFGWHRHPWFPFEFILLYLGLAIIARRLYKDLSGRNCGWLSAVGVLLLVHFVFLLLFLPCDMARYYSPFATMLRIPAALGTIAVARAFAASIRLLAVPERRGRTPGRI
jgi:hypothetical protein